MSYYNRYIRSNGLSKSSSQPNYLIPYELNDYNNIYLPLIKMNQQAEILSEKIDSTKTKSPKLITTIDNISNIRHKIHKYPKPKIKLPLIKTRKLLTEADLIVKKGKKLEGLSPIHIPVDIKVKQSVAINLKNNLIGKIIEKRVGWLKSFLYLCSSLANKSNK